MVSFKKIWRLKGRVFCIAAVMGMSAWSFWSWRHVRYQADAIVAVQISGGVSEHSNVLSLAKKISSYPQIEKVARVINRSKTNTEKTEGGQWSVQILQSKIDVIPQAGTGMIIVRAYDPNQAIAVRLANEVARQAAEIKDVSLENNPDTKIKWNEAQIKASKAKIEALEKEIFEFQKKWSWASGKARVESQIMAKQGERALLLEKFTSKHPEILRIDEEIEQLQKELVQENFLGKEFEALAEQLKKEQNNYSQAVQSVEQAQFERISQPASIRLVSAAARAHKAVIPPSTPIICFALLFCLCVGVVTAILTGSNRIS